MWRTPVVSLGKMIESGFTFSFNDYKCYMHRGNKRVEIFRKGRIFVLRMRRRWLKSTAHMIAPIDEVADEEMGVADDGEGAGGAEAAVQPRVDEPGDDPPPPRPREVRPSPMRPGAEAVRQHNLTHCPYQSWCEVCLASKGKSDHYHREAPVSKDGDVARVQMDFMFVGAEGTFVDEPRATATVLMVVCEDDGNLSATEVRTKTDEYGVEMVLRFLSTYEDVEIKTDGKPSIVEIASEGTISTGQDNDSGTDKCWRKSRDWSSGTCERNSSGSIVCVFPGRAGSHESASHSWHTAVSMDVAAFSVDGGASPC